MELIAAALITTVLYLYSRWEFWTYDHDIRFGIKSIDKTSGEEIIELELRRVASHQLHEEGFIACRQNWNCEYQVSNDYSGTDPL